MDFLSLLLAFRAVFAESSDADLVTAIARGEEASFERLFLRYHGDLFRFLTRHGVPQEAGEDILQDVFTAVWTGRSRLDPSRSIRAYLYRACRNRAANYFRGRARIDESPSDEAASMSPGQDEQLSHEMLQRRLEEAVRLLPDRRRAVFELCFLAGLSYKEAAEALDVSPKTIENQMGHALKTIRNYLAPLLERRGS